MYKRTSIRDSIWKRTQHGDSNTTEIRCMYVCEGRSPGPKIEKRFGNTSVQYLLLLYTSLNVAAIRTRLVCVCWCVCGCVPCG